MRDTLSNSLKRKRSPPCLSSPPLELYDLQEQEQEQGQEQGQEQSQEQLSECLHRRKEQEDRATQTEVNSLRGTTESLAPAWTGRGRSPYKTPVTAVLDEIKYKTRQLEAFDRELITQQAELDSWIAERRVCLESVAAQKTTLSMNQPPSGRQVLPKPAKTSQGRSSSPDKYLRALRNGKPPIVNIAFGGSQGDIPQSVTDLLARLTQKLGEGCIPAQYKGIIEKTQPYNPVPDSAYSTTSSHLESSQESLWSTVQEITEQARVCEEEKRDEMAWSMDVNRSVFKLDTNGDKFSRLEYIQTQTIDETCLPKHGEKAGPKKKTDFALSFSPQHPDIKKHYEQVKIIDEDDDEEPALSQMNDISTSHCGLYLGAEVKKLGGNENEAKGQLFTWLGSGVIKQRQLLLYTASSQPIPELTMPLLGYTIVGYDWKFYVAYGHGCKETDNIHILGPLPDLNIGTSSYHQAFRLLQFDERVKRWARNTYWPWFRDRIIEPLK